MTFKILPTSELVRVPLTLPDRPFVPWQVTTPPVASFTAVPSSGTVPLNVVFTDTSTGSPVGWVWDFGDGSTSVVQNPTHIYTGGGTFTVNLTVFNAMGQISSTTSTVVAVAGDPLWAYVKSLLHFDDADGTTIPADSVPGTTWTNSVPGRAVVRETEKKFGSGSLARPFDPGGQLAGGLLGTFTGIDFTLTTKYTFEYWIYFTSWTTWGAAGARHFAFNQAGSGDGAIALIADSNRKLRIEQTASGVGTATMVLNRWYHIAMTSDGTTGRCFLDGNLEFTYGLFNIGTNISLNVSPGRCSWGNGDYYEGYIDEFRWTHGECRYTAPFTPPSAPFLSN